MYRFVFLITLILFGNESQGGFFGARSDNIFGRSFLKITQAQKNEMVKCGFYTYLLEKSITNSNDISTHVTDNDYANFVQYLVQTYAPGESDVDGRKHLMLAFQDYDSFIELLATAYDEGGMACDAIRESRQGCNAFCGGMTCADPFTFATCHGMAKELEGQKVCEPGAVQKCFKNGVNDRWQKVPNKTWFTEIDKSWFKVFFTTAGTNVDTGAPWGLERKEIQALIGALFIFEFSSFLTGSNVVDISAEDKPWFSYVTRQLKNPSLKKHLWSAAAKRGRQGMVG